MLVRVWLLPNLNFTELGVVRTRARTLFPRGCKNFGRSAAPITHRLAPVSTIASIPSETAKHAKPSEVTSSSWAVAVPCQAGGLSGGPARVLKGGRGFGFRLGLGRGVPVGRGGRCLSLSTKPTNPPLILNPVVSAKATCASSVSGWASGGSSWRISSPSGWAAGWSTWATVAGASARVPLIDPGRPYLGHSAFQ